MVRGCAACLTKDPGTVWSRNVPVTQHCWRQVFASLRQAGGVSKQQQQRHRQQSARQLMTALLDLAHLCIQKDAASNSTAAASPGSKTAVSQRTLGSAASAAAGSDTHGSLLQYARLSC